jgi:primary-amine oxidase
VEKNVRLGPEFHGLADGVEIEALEKLMLDHPDIKLEIEKIGLPKGTVVVCEPWIFGGH